MEAAKWFRCIDVATDRNHRAGPREILTVARELYPDDLRKDETAAADRGHLRALSDAMRQALDHEETGTGPKAQLDLPGLTAPAYISVPAEVGANPIIKYRKAVRSDLRAFVTLRVKLRNRIDLRIRDLRVKNQFLFPFMPDDTVTVEQAIARRHEAEKAGRRA